MATTRKKIREQIQIEYSRFIEKNGFNDNIDVRVIDLHVNQSINRLLSVQFKNSMRVGSVEVPTSNLIKYTIAATTEAEMPVFPINLPFGMGVWTVAKSSAPTVYLIPIPKAFHSVYSGTSAANLEGQVGYYISGKTLLFTEAIGEDVIVELLVSDFTTTGEEDLLPVSPELESEVILDVLDLISKSTFSQAELNSKDTRENVN